MTATIKAMSKMEELTAQEIMKISIDIILVNGKMTKGMALDNSKSKISLVNMRGLLSMTNTMVEEN